YDVPCWGANVEVEAPVDVVVVFVADARARDRVEAEAWTDPPVCVQPPLAHVAVPARLQFADEHDLLPFDVDRGAEERPLVRIGVEDRLRRLRAEEEPGCDVRPRSLDHPLLVLPVAVRAALVAVVSDVEDRDVRLVEHAFPPVVDIAKLDPGA